MIQKILQRFKDISGAETTQDIANILDISIHTIYSWTKNKKISADAFIKYCEETNISLDWLLFGKGFKYNSLVSFNTKETLNHDKDLNTIYIPYYEDIRLSAGYGATNADYVPSDMVCLPKALLSCSEKTEAVKVIGDSMIPTIADGSIAYVDRIEIEKIKNNSIYAIRIGNDILVKRLFVVPSGILVRSDNKDYPEFTCQQEDIVIIGEIKGVTQRL